MDEQRTRARSARRGDSGHRGEAAALSSRAGFETEFVGYETTEAETTIGAVQLAEDGSLLVKLRESPFYATGGGQVADLGVLECDGGGCRALVTDVIRLGTDQVVQLQLEHGVFEPGGRVHAQVDRATRHATACNHTATHLLHAALRRRLGDHVHQAGSYVGPDKLRFDFTHGTGLSAEELADVTDEVNRFIQQASPVRALTTTLDEARGHWGRWRCSTRSTATSCAWSRSATGRTRASCAAAPTCATPPRSACCGSPPRPPARPTCAASRRSPAPRPSPSCGSATVSWTATAEVLRVPGERVAETVSQLRAQVRELERTIKQGGGGTAASIDVDALAASATEAFGASVLTAIIDGVADADALLALCDTLQGRLGDAAIVLGRAADGRVDLVASVAPALVQRGVKAGAIVKLAAAEVGGGGGGRDTMARGRRTRPREAAPGNHRGQGRDRGGARRLICRCRCGCWPSITEVHAAAARSRTPRGSWPRRLSPCSHPRRARGARGCVN